MKENLWKAIEAYRMAGGREEHWRTFIPGDGCLNCLTEDAKEKTE